MEGYQIVMRRIAHDRHCRKSTQNSNINININIRTKADVILSLLTEKLVPFGIYHADPGQGCSQRPRALIYHLWVDGYRVRRTSTLTRGPDASQDARLGVKAIPSKSFRPSGQG
jgi:hypothetical protein